MKGWIKGVDYPNYMNESALITLKADYLQGEETPKEALKNIARKAELEVGVDGLADKVFEYVWEGYIGLSSPIWSNFGRQRGLPISCFNSHFSDSILDFKKKDLEIAIMSQNGGGTSAYFGEIRHRGAPIKNTNAKANGVMSPIKMVNNTVEEVSQGGVRRGMLAGYLDFSHPDIMEFLDIRDVGNSVQTITSGVVLSKEDVNNIIKGDSKALSVWAKICEKRNDMGIPYLMFKENAENHISTPIPYKKGNGNSLNSSNLCVSGDTKILTDFGYKEIEELEGQFVNIWNGEEFSEVEIFKTGENKELLNIVTDSGYELKCTPEHKFYIQNSYDKKSIEEKKAFDLKEGDKLIKFNLPTIEGHKTLKYSYTQGFFSGDGCIPNDGRHLSNMIYLYGGKQDLLPYIDVRNKYTNTGTKSILTSEKAIKKSDSVERTACYVPEDIIADKAFVPDSSYTIKSRLEWLAGILDSDGTVTNNQGSQSLQIGSVDKGFLKDIQLMLQTLGCDSKVTFLRKEGRFELPANDGTGLNKFYNCKEVNRLLINGNSLYKLIELGLNCHRLKWEVRKPNRECSIFIKVKCVKELPDLYDTYCFTEPKKNLGMFNGILTGQCSEILLPSTKDESFVCCLASMNLATYDDWKTTDAVKVAIYLLEAVMSEFIRKASQLEGMEAPVKFAKRHMALGLGTLGEHTFLQERKIPFTSIIADSYRRSIYGRIKRQAEEASVELADMFGACEVNKQFGIHKRHTTLMAIAPTTTNALISGDVSPGIEPWVSNIFQRKVAKGSFLKKNPILEQLLREKEQDTAEVWDSIVDNFGSVQHLNFLTEEEKEVFLTAFEINQYGLIKASSLRQLYICQSQSLNLFVLPNTPAKDRSELYLTACLYGVKTLYYQRSLSNLKEGQSQEKVQEYFNKTATKAFDSSCTACEG